jgi:hypothetical protein
MAAKAATQVRLSNEQSAVPVNRFGWVAAVHAKHGSANDAAMTNR